MPVFTLSIFLSAFLLFIVQPILAKKLLPWFGGSPAVWLSIVLFFQTALLLGYSYAFLLAKIKRIRLSLTIHFSLLCFSFLFIPLKPIETMAQLPFWQPIVVFIVLSMTLSLPIMMISATSPLFQHWYCSSYQTEFPTRLYAISNAGSLLGLLTFPFFLEPLMGLQQQLSYWSYLYGVFFLTSSLCIIFVFIKEKHQPAKVNKASSILMTKKPILLWLILSFLSCCLLLSITQMMMQGIVNFPLLWLIPLTLYLLSFIVTFSCPRFYVRFFWIVVYSSLACVLFLIHSHHQLLLLIQIILFSALLFSGCMICHGELFNLKPAKQHLAFYYLIIALGGVLGSLFVNLVAPLFFNEWWDFDVALIGIIFIVGYLVFYTSNKSNDIPPFRFFYEFKCLWLGLILALLTFLFFHYKETHKDVIANYRNFFGKSEIVQRDPDNENWHRILRNGNIIHGQQYLVPSKQLIATTYFSPQSGAGLAFEFERQQKNHLRIGAIGLGAGTLAALAQKGDFLQFYEIDPDMRNIAQHFFYYLRATSANTKIVIGDGRMSLARELKENGSQNYDILVVDAFNGDAIPLHLLTKEALNLYLSHLSIEGILAFHISSRYVDLFPPLEALATHLGLYAYLAHNLPEESHSVFTSEWVLLSRQPQIGLFLYQKKALIFNSKRMNTIWTDDYHYLLSVIRW